MLDPTKVTYSDGIQSRLSDMKAGGLFYQNGNVYTPVGIHKNLIINGNFDLWQRGTSFNTYAYSADRFSGGGVGDSVTQTQQAFTIGQTDVPGEPKYFYRSAVTSVAGAGNAANFQQAVESARTLAGQTATLSFWAKADANKNIAVEFIQQFGAGGSPSASVLGIGSTLIPLTTKWKRYSVTVAVPSVAGKTFGTTDDGSFNVVWWFDAGSNFASRTANLGQQSGTFDIAQVQLERGAIATEFEYRPIGLELTLAQRYYEKSFPLATAPANRAGTGIYTTIAAHSIAAADSAFISFMVRKRIVPSITIYAGNNTAAGANAWQYYNAGWLDSNNLANYPFETGFMTQLGPNGTFTVGQAYLAAGDWVASAEF